MQTVIINIVITIIVKHVSFPFKQALENIAAEKAPGPPATFSIFHLVLAIELIAEKSVGRNKLAKSLCVGDGVIRTIIGRLKHAGLVATSKGGCHLTSEGLALWKDYKSIFRKRVEIGKNEFTLSAYNFALLIKGYGHKVKSGMEQRDAAIRAGAKATTTIICKGGFLVIPFVSNNVAKDFPMAGNQIVKLLEPEENDVIIIAGADTSIKAQHGAFAAAWTLFD
ncbi:MAG: DUF4443 domain-containing protein [Candidatus Bathycorpusculaceae bacterium]